MWSTEDTEDVNRLDRILGSMERRSWEPCRAVRLHAAIAYARARDWHKAIAWFEPAVRGGGATFGVVVLLTLGYCFVSAGAPGPCEKLPLSGNSCIQSMACCLRCIPKHMSWVAFGD